MAKTELPITGGFYENRSLPISSQECTNYYVHINQGGGQAKESLFGTAGINQLATSGVLTTDANRGSHVMDGIAYFVNGTSLYRLTRTISGTGAETFALDNLGTVAGSGQVSMADNGTQLCIVVPAATSNAYIWNEGTTTFTDITSATNFKANGEPQHVVFVDGYFLFTTDSSKFIVSALNDGTTYSALDVLTAEADPDDIVAPIVHNNIVYIGGGETFEPFQNIGGSGFPFQRIKGGVMNKGVFAPFSLINVSDTFFFIGGGTNEGPSVYAFSGNGFSPVSSDGIDFILEGLTDTQMSNVFAWAYSENGARFVGFALPSTTIVYDLTSQRWHERKSFDVIDDVADEFRFRVNSVTKAYGRILVGDSIDGRVGELSLDFLDEYGTNIVSRVSTMPFSNNGDRILVALLEAQLEAGVGNDNDSNPTISLERSLDGKTWSDPAERLVGKMGQYQNRAQWRRQGRAANTECFRFSQSGKFKKVLIKLQADLL